MNETTSMIVKIKLFLKIVFRAIVMGFELVLLYFCLVALKDLLFSVTHGGGCIGIVYFPLQLYWRITHIQRWDDLAILLFLFGSCFTLFSRLLPYIRIAPKNGGNIIRITLLVIFCIGLLYQTQQGIAIQKTYFEFCRAIENRNYPLAYSYFSPDYRRQVGADTFVNEWLDLNSRYLHGCDGEFNGKIWHRWNGAALYPISWTNTACSLFFAGPELILVRVDGEWYFTGEDTWYMD